MITISAFNVASHFIGVKEIPGVANNAQIAAFLLLDHDPLQTFPDEIAWCSAFVNYIAWLLNLPRSKSWSARSWIKVGTAIDIRDARPDCDIVILKRGNGSQPGPEVLEAPGHVGFFSGIDSSGNILLLGGNQGDQVSIKPFARAHILGVRRLA